MNSRKLVSSITLGIALAVALLVGLGRDSSNALASARSFSEVQSIGSKETLSAGEPFSTAYVVVRFSDAESIVRAITFTEPITAYASLERSGLELDVLDMGWGLMLCGIDGVGQSLPDESGCNNGTRHWGTSYWDGEAWIGRMAGIADVLITETGHVEGFSFGDPGWTAVDPPPATPLTAASDALDWLREQQQARGSFGSANDTTEVLLSVASNAMDGAVWKNGNSLLANVMSRGPEFADLNAAGAGKLATALNAQDACWPVGADRPLDHFKPASGTFSVDTLYQAWGILGTAALSDTVPVSAVESLRLNQQANGGWELFVGFGSDTNTTALALQALIATGEPLTSTSVVSGLTYLQGAQNDDGGFPYSPDSPYGTQSDVNSTSYVVQAIVAAGQDPVTGTWVISDANPIGYLLDMQLPSGSFEWQTPYGPNQSATRQAILALLYRPFPLQVETVADCHGISGKVTSGIGAAPDSALPDVTLTATGHSRAFFDTTDASGAYTVSVLSGDTYALTPVRTGFTFSPTMQNVDVPATSGGASPGMDFQGAARVYLPLALRD